jgi:hypothetical protein
MKKCNTEIEPKVIANNFSIFACAAARAFYIKTGCFFEKLKTSEIGRLWFI